MHLQLTVFGYTQTRPHTPKQIRLTNKSASTAPLPADTHKTTPTLTTLYAGFKTPPTCQQRHRTPLHSLFPSTNNPHTPHADLPRTPSLVPRLLSTPNLTTRSFSPNALAQPSCRGSFTKHKHSPTLHPPRLHLHADAPMHLQLTVFGYTQTRPHTPKQIRLTNKSASTAPLPADTHKTTPPLTTLYAGFKTPPTCQQPHRTPLHSLFPPTNTTLHQTLPLRQCTLSHNPHTNTNSPNAPTNTTHTPHTPPPTHALSRTTPSLYA
ncbi:hypothetical protein, conserved [Eimeria tenella]|uniref:Uncharacterized protein n=1 Tax=Eimeria tenella TaxID=5802 RepID=U6KGM3_EIMTE|nr:hypothetical protein, conserved [Eimeria tenella]CDJ37104.1 hypothetical protein, conserved [Eimeria tenella]|eukprot:XP_013227942.1 hypothetical protein, conserved [Eimeria tenella]